jgi:hypothetical protein
MLRTLSRQIARLQRRIDELEKQNAELAGILADFCDMTTRTPREVIARRVRRNGVARSEGQAKKMLSDHLMCHLTCRR